MPIRILSTLRFKEPRTWSIGMCSIAVVMLLMTFSQSGSFDTNVSHIVKSTQVSEVSYGVAPGKVYQVVPDRVVQQPGVITRDAASQYGRTEPFIESETVEVDDGANRKFMRYVRQARFAKLIDNNELSASLVMEAQALLFGSAEPE